MGDEVAEVVGFRGKVVFDAGQIDGTPRELLDANRLRQLGWEATTPLREGLEQTCRWFVAHSE